MIQQNTIPIAAITGNSTYVNLRAIRWQIPLVQQLCFASVPIEGLAIGAGVRSIEVANKCIETIVLIQLSVKLC